MKSHVSASKVNRHTTGDPSQHSSASENAVALAPPDYGIEFVDRGLAAGAAVQLGLNRIEMPGAEGIRVGGRDEKRGLSPIGLSSIVHSTCESPEGASEREADHFARIMELPAGWPNHERMRPRTAPGAGGVDASTRSAIESARWHGQPLPDQTRERLEIGTGESLRNVRVHTDQIAHGLSTKLRADAFTYGTDIFFREGQYDPASQEGSRTLAHEVAHTIQQQDAGLAVQRQQHELLYTPSAAPETPSPSTSEPLSSEAAIPTTEPLMSRVPAPRVPERAAELRRWVDALIRAADVFSGTVVASTQVERASTEIDAFIDWLMSDESAAVLGPDWTPAATGAAITALWRTIEDAEAAAEQVEAGGEPRFVTAARVLGVARMIAFRAGYSLETDLALTAAQGRSALPTLAWVAEQGARFAEGLSEDVYEAEIEGVRRAALARRASIAELRARAHALASAVVVVASALDPAAAALAREVELAAIDNAIDGIVDLIDFATDFVLSWISGLAGVAVGVIRMVILFVPGLYRLGQLLLEVLSQTSEGELLEEILSEDFRSTPEADPEAETRRELGAHRFQRLRAGILGAIGAWQARYDAASTRQERFFMLGDVVAQLAAILEGVRGAGIRPPTAVTEMVADAGRVAETLATHAEPVLVPVGGAPLAEPPLLRVPGGRTPVPVVVPPALMEGAGAPPTGEPPTTTGSAEPSPEPPAAVSAETESDPHMTAVESPMSSAADTAAEAPPPIGLSAVDAGQFATAEAYLAALRAEPHPPGSVGAAWDYARFPNGPRRLWAPGDPIDMPSRRGEYPTFDTARGRIWRNRAHFEIEARARGEAVHAPGGTDPIAAMSDDALGTLRDTSTSRVRSPTRPVTGIAEEIEHSGVPQRAGRWMEAAGFTPNDARRLSGVADPHTLDPMSPLEHAFFDAEAHGFGSLRADAEGRMWELTPTSDPRVEQPLFYMTNDALAEVVRRVNTDPSITLANSPELRAALDAEIATRGLSLTLP